MLILTMIVISMLLMLIARVTMTIQVCTWNHTVSKVFNNEQVESGLLALSLPCWHLLRIREMDEGVLHLGFYMDVRQTSAPPTPSTRINRPMSSALSHQCHPWPYQDTGALLDFIAQRAMASAGLLFPLLSWNPTTQRMLGDPKIGWTWMNMINTRGNSPTLQQEICLSSKSKWYWSLSLASTSHQICPWNALKASCARTCASAAKRVSLFLFPPTSLGRVRPWGSRWVSAL